MAEDTRRPVVIAVVVGVVVVLVFVLGVGFGGRGEVGGGGWVERLQGLGAARPLASDDLVAIGGDCEIGTGSIGVGGSCVLEVASAGGRISLGTPTRRALLVPEGSAVRLSFAVEDQEMEVDADPGKEVDLTFGRSGGRLALACLGAPACAVILAAPDA